MDPQQLRLEVEPVERPEALHELRERTRAPASLGPRLALSPDEAASVLGVSRDFLDKHVLSELRIVRRGRRILIALTEIDRWLERAATVRGAIEPRTRRAAGA